MSALTSEAWQARVGAADWARVAAELDEVGGALIGPLLDDGETDALIELYDDDGAFRSTIDMARYRFGDGQYRYLSYPLPAVIDELRHALYPRLVAIAREWAARLDQTTRWPDTLDEWLEQCHEAGQTRPTPLILKYGLGDWNALHRDLYGEHVFPLQVVINLTEVGVDYDGGEFLLVEQRPRAQSRGTTIALPRGEGVVFTTRDRPIPVQKGWSAAPVKHGVSVVRRGRRLAVGILFHDAT